VENEVPRCILSNVDEIRAFFGLLEERDSVALTWDIQNLWQMGVPPTVDVYEALKPLIGFVHLKGGMAESGSTPLKWRSSLEDASWDVAGIVRRVVADGTSPVICLNPSHGERKDGYDDTNMAERDLEYARRIVSEGNA
ncbi:MAG: xylose isomerase, partial [Candidatus Poribacteria bacterium]|nr:xylose isomerase [Candidatus Poribacteria bacterium]